MNWDPANVYYVYALLDPRKPGPVRFGRHVFDHEPFYVGKGKGDRARNHLNLKAGNKHSKNVVRSIRKAGLTPLISIRRQHLDEHSAMDLESKLICRIGRADLGTGPLANWSNGWDTGLAGVSRCAAFRDKCSKSQKARFENESERESQRQKTVQWRENNPEGIASADANRRAALQSDEHREKMRRIAKDNIANDPDLVTRQTVARQAAFIANNSAAKISASLGGRPVHVYADNKLVDVCVSLHEVSRKFGVSLCSVQSGGHRGKNLRFVRHTISFACLPPVVRGRFTAAT